MHLFTISARFLIWTLCYFGLIAGQAAAQSVQLASSVVPTPINTDDAAWAADNSTATSAALNPGINNVAASERVQFATLIEAGTTRTGVSLRFDNVALNLLQAQVLPDVSIATYLDGVATGEVWTSSQLLTLSILVSRQQTEVPLQPAPTKSFNQLELRANGAVNAYVLQFFDAFGPSPTPLPVQLVSFTAAAVPGSPAVRLAWTTATELRNAYFAVERSLDGTQFVTAGQVAAAGTGAATQAYAYVDADAPAGQLYYRLRQVDQDGTTTYSATRTLAARPLGAPAAGLALYPVPARHQATLTGAQPGAEVQLRTAAGQLLLRATTDATGTAPLPLPAGLAPGVYFVRTGAQTTRLSVVE